MGYQQPEVAKRTSTPRIVDRIGGRKSSAFDCHDAIRQQIVFVPISEAGMIAGCGSVAVKAKKLHLRFGHRVAAGVATHDLSWLVVIYAVMAELSPAFRADVSVVGFERSLYRLIAAFVVMNKRLLSQMAGMAFDTDFACMQARRVAMLTDVQPFKKPAAQQPGIGQLLEDVSSITDARQERIGYDSGIIGPEQRCERAVASVGQCQSGEAVAVWPERLARQLGNSCDNRHDGENGGRQRLVAPVPENEIGARPKRLIPGDDNRCRTIGLPEQPPNCGWVCIAWEKNEVVVGSRVELVIHSAESRQ